MATKHDAVDVETAASPTGQINSHTKTASSSFAGRIGGNQAFIVDRHDGSNTALLRNEPDAAPGMSLKEQLDIRPFRAVGLWKAAMVSMRIWI